jgi:hypothetical protein
LKGLNCGSLHGRAKYKQNATLIYESIECDCGELMKRTGMSFLNKILVVLACSASFGVQSFELLSEGAMGSVSAVTANSAEEIISIAGTTAAGLRVDDEYESLPFQTSVEVEAYATDEVSEELNFALTQEVDAWAQTLRQRNDEVSTENANLEIGYINELPESSFDESSFVVRDDEFDRLIFEPPAASDSDQESTIFEIGRVEQTLTKIQQNADAVEYIVRREVDFVATIDASISDGSPSIGSAYISNLSSISNVKIAAIRD